MNGSKKHMSRLLVALMAVGVAGVADAAISATKHNLGSGGTGTNKVTGSGATGTDEICVFCHTPHAANTNVVAPLWNKNMPANTYTMYGTASTTMQSTIASAPGGISLVCLSCHDGTQAMDNIINAPGSGGLTANGGGATGLTWTWSGAGATAAGLMSGSVAMLGTDLSNDHPIGIRYCGNANTSAVACTDGDFRSYDASGYVNSDGTAGKQKTDMWLYRRSTADTGLYVECASCHDPHSGNSTFLRVANTNSAVCLACHIK